VGRHTTICHSAPALQSSRGYYCNIQTWGDISTTDSDDDASEDGGSIEDEDEDGSGPDDDEPHRKGNSPGGSTLTDN